ncbi:unnamed protein product [Microthlaspi erraticum]|uniref:Uncharacterized protein n=1 Tax=Microthlaspi erraticum TaxID=1685480 RepID=A0A6D2JPV6_9BRAS|nr:unnamed protein product [Microthlaspi erraticum]
MMMRGGNGIGRRLANPKGLTLIGSLLNRTPQLLSYFSSSADDVFAAERRLMEQDSESDDDKEAIIERLSKYQWASQYPECLSRKDEKREIARIANTVPESAPDVAKQYAVYVAYNLQRCDEMTFEDKIRRMHEVIEEVSRG